MIGVTKQVFYTSDEFAAGFLSRRQPAVATQSLESFIAVTHFVAGTLMAEGFRLFRNGGIPLLERREGALIEEIVFQPGADPRLLTVKIHLSHTGLKDIRARYWTTPARAPIGLASGNVGELDLPPGWAVWTVSEDGEGYKRLSGWLKAVAIPWFELFEDPSLLRLILRDRDVPLLGPIAKLEWLLAEFGKREARPIFDDLVREGGTALSWQDRDRLQSLDACFHLHRRA